MSEAGNDTVWELDGGGVWNRLAAGAELTGSSLLRLATTNTSLPGHSSVQLMETATGLKAVIVQTVLPRLRPPRPAGNRTGLVVAGREDSEVEVELERLLGGVEQEQRAARTACRRGNTSVLYCTILQCTHEISPVFDGWISEFGPAVLESNSTVAAGLTHYLSTGSRQLGWQGEQPLGLDPLTILLCFFSVWPEKPRGAKKPVQGPYSVFFERRREVTATCVI